MFLPTAKQREAAELLGGRAANVMLYGGSGSGKTAVICWRLAHNALTCPGTRQGILRKHLNTVRTTIGNDTMPFILDAEKIPHKYNDRDHVFRFRNGSEIWLMGLDDKERTEKVLGKGFFTMYYNECSEISWHAVQMGMTRNRVKVERDIFGNPRRNRFYFDCNPPSKRHWCYKSFVLKKEPQKNTLWQKPHRWDYLLMNPEDNRVNLGNEYIDSVLGEFTGKMKDRFLRGIFSDDAENALWNQDTMIDPFRVTDFPQDLERIVIGVDPAVSNKDNSNATGIVVAGKKNDRYYVMDDRTLKAAPEVWAKAVESAFHHYRADRIIVETNNGGDLLRSLFRMTNRNLPIMEVHAKRGKILRAEPVAAMYSRGEVSHVGEQAELEDQMCNFTGADGEDSPDNLDAMVYALTALTGKLASVAQVSGHFGVI